MRRNFALACVCLPALALATPAAAGEVFGGVHAHDVDFIAIGGFEKGTQLSVGYRTEPIEGLRVIGSPSAQAFAAGNTAGGVAYGVAGLSWRFGDRIFIRPGIGVAVHNGEVNDFQIGSELNLGSRVLAELELGVGWQVNERLSVEASIVHLSHGQSRGEQNPGLDDVGVRISYRF
jgi:hypothetical protein